MQCPKNPKEDEMKTLILMRDGMSLPTDPSKIKNHYANLIIRVLVIIGLLMFFSSESIAGKAVQYTGNGQTTGTAPATANYNNNDTVTVSSNSGNLVKTGFVFSGWNTNSAGTGTTYQPDNTFTMGTSDITLYAKWVAAAAQTPPTMGNVPNQTATVGTAFSLSISSYVTQTDGDAITSYTLTGTLPAGLSFNTTTGVISGTPTSAGAAVTFSVTATDNDGTSNSDSFTITVNAAGGGGFTNPPGQCGLFGSVLTSFTQIISGGNNIQVCSETVLSYPSGLAAPNIDCSASGCGNGTCTRMDPPASRYSVTFPTLPSTFLDITSDTTYSPNQIYSGDTVAGYRTFGDVRVSGNSGRTITFAPGDYYFNTLVFPDNNAKIVISGGGPVRIFVKDNLVLDKNGYEVNTGGTANQLFVYVGGNLTLNSNGGGNGGLNAYFYVKEQTTFEGNSNWTLTGGVVSEGSIQINGNNPDFIAYSGGAGGGYGDCVTAYTYQTGVFDAVDQCNAHNIGCLTTKIKTKIVNKPMTLTALSLNTARTALQTRNPTVSVDVSLAKNNGTAYDIVKSLGTYNFTSSVSALDISSITHDKAAKDLNVLFRYCTDGNGSGGIYSWNGGSCGIGKITNFCFSSDNFAIRPEKLDISSTDSVTVAALPNLMKAGQTYSLLVKGYNYNSTTPTVDYNVSSANNISPVITKYNRLDSTPGGMVGTETVGAYTITNGVSNNVGFAFDDVGKINISLQDQNWSAVDINNINDTTPHDCSANGAYVCGDKNVTFIPDRFEFTELNITNNNANPGTFTYLANEVNQMAGRINTKISALNQGGAVTQNFATSPLWENPVSIIPVVTTSSYLYPDANETTIVNLPLGFTAGVKTIPWNETNTSKYLRFNFQRDVNPATPPSPLDVVGSNLNITATSTYTDIEDGDTAIITGVRNGTALGTAKFVYGRIIPRDVRVFGENTPFTANAWYEVYNTPTIGSAGLPVSRNDGTWYTNTLHSDIVDGDGNVTVVVTGANPTNATAANGIETYSFTNGYTLGGYKAHILTVPWLWYGVNAATYANPGTDCLTHPCFNINVVPPVGATGSAKGGAEENKASKRSESNGWRSTSDYAPATR